MDILLLTGELIGLAKPSDKIKGRNLGLEKIATDLGWEIAEAAITKNPRNGNQVPHYIFRTGGGGKHLAFVSHWDVVPYGKNWNTNPCFGAVKDGIIYGRGACDMMGSIAAQLRAGKEIAAGGKTVSIFLSGDEETDSLGMPLLLEKNSLQIDYALGGEPTGKKEAGDTIKAGRRGLVQGNIFFYGVQFHSAYVDEEKGTNLCRKIMEGGLAEIIQPYDQGNGLLPPTTMAICLIESANENKTYNSIPGVAKIGFDARIASDPDTFLLELKRRLNQTMIRYRLKIKYTVSPYFIKNETFQVQVVDSIEAVLGRKPEIDCRGGFSDCRFFAEAKIPVMEVGLENSTIHKVNEKQSIENLEKLESIYCEIGKRI
ncbi:MAG: M20/M25/M40 family metallo-hydrolase [Candidatus Woesearchaeota archaeon]